jgi:hypothetical protein
MTMLQRIMNDDFSNSAAMSDAELLRAVRTLACQEQNATARLIAALGELDARRLYLGEGCSSLFSYCTQVLHLSEHAAYGRIEAARAARKWPSIVQLLAEGAVHLTAIGLLAPHLTDANHHHVLASARHKSKRQVEEIVAALQPRPPVPSSVRKVPEIKAAPVVMSVPVVPIALPDASTASHHAPMPLRPLRSIRPVAEITPLAPEHYKVQFTVSRETHDKLRQAQDLLRHCVPNGDVAAIFERALTLLLAELQRTKHAATGRPRSSRPCGSPGRYIPAGVKREVWERDGGQCAFVGTAGRCSERGFLEYHHVVPFADGGATTADNLELRCRAHNAYEAGRWLGVGEADLVRERGEPWGSRRAGEPVKWRTPKRRRRKAAEARGTREPARAKPSRTSRSMKTALPRPKYDSPVQRTRFYEPILREVRALPGVRSAAFTSGLPMVVTGLVTAVEVPGQDPRSARSAGASHRWVTPQFFKTKAFRCCAAATSRTATLAIGRGWR